jgi:hypothetical protein
VFLKDWRLSQLPGQRPISARMRSIAFHRPSWVLGVEVQPGGAEEAAALRREIDAMPIPDLQEDAHVTIYTAPPPPSNRQTDARTAGSKLYSKRHALAAGHLHCSLGLLCHLHGLPVSRVLEGDAQGHYRAVSSRARGEKPATEGKGRGEGESAERLLRASSSGLQRVRWQGALEGQEVGGPRGLGGRTYRTGGTRAYPQP